MGHLSLFYSGYMIFLKSNVRFSRILLPKSPFSPYDSLLHQKISEILFDILLRLCAHHFCYSRPPINPYGKLLTLAIHTIIPHWSCYYKIPWSFFTVPKILCAYCLAVLCHMNTPSNKSSHLSSIRSSPVVHVFYKSLPNAIRSSEYPLQTIARQILVCLQYGCFPYV